MNVNMKRFEVIIFVLTAIVLAFLVGLLSNAVFQTYYERNERLFTNVVIIISIVLILILIAMMLSKSEVKSSKTTCVCTYCVDEMKFIKIPHCIPSVHAKLTYEDLPQELRKEFSESNEQKLAMSPGSLTFVNILVDKLILEFIINSRKKEKVITIEDLPEKIRERVKLGDQRTFKLHVPNWVTIESWGNEFIRVKTKFGVIKFYWNLSIHSEGYYSEPYLKIIDLKHCKKYRDYCITIHMKYYYNLWKMFSKEMDEFILWVNGLEEKMEKLDWERTEKYLPILLLQTIVEEINKNGGEGNGA